MFTGIVQGVAEVLEIVERPGLRSLRLRFPPGFDEGLTLGASVACSGVCLTVTARPAPDQALFDAMQQTLALTSLGDLQVGSRVHVERAAREGAEVGGHLLSGHVDCCASLLAIRQPENNRVLRLAMPASHMRYVFAKGYIAVDGASLTVAEVNPEQGWFEVWLIPETLRMTTFGAREVGARLNIEIERATQVMVDSVHAAVAQQLGPLLPALRSWAAERGLAVDGALGLASGVASGGAAGGMTAAAVPAATPAQS